MRSLNAGLKFGAIKCIDSSVLFCQRNVDGYIRPSSRLKLTLPSTGKINKGLVTFPWTDSIACTRAKTDFGKSSSVSIFAIKTPEDDFAFFAIK